MSKPCYPEEFKIEAVKQVTEGAYLWRMSLLAWVCRHIDWVKRYSKPPEKRTQEDDL